MNQCCLIKLFLNSPCSLPQGKVPMIYLSFWIKFILSQMYLNTKTVIPLDGKEKSDHFKCRKPKSSPHWRCGEKGGPKFLLCSFLNMLLNQITSVHTACCLDSPCLADNSGINSQHMNSLLVEEVVQNYSNYFEIIVAL